VIFIRVADDSFIKISLVDTTEMREILVARRVSGRWLYNAGVSREMRETWQVWVLQCHGWMDGRTTCRVNTTLCAR